MSITLALDLGARCGFAYSDGEIERHGTWVLHDAKKGNNPVKAERYIALRNYLDDLHSKHPINEIVYEIAFHGMKGGIWALHQFGAYESIVQIWCYEHDIQSYTRTASEIKKWTTDNGLASKELMYTEALRRWSYDPTVVIPTRGYEFGVPDSNEVDAYCLLKFYLSGDIVEKAKKKTTKKKLE